MSTHNLRCDNSPSVPENPEAVPAGTPDWITESLIALTKRTWQPRYREPLTTHDAVTMLTSVARLFALLRPGASHETIRRAGPCLLA